MKPFLNPFLHGKLPERTRRNDVLLMAGTVAGTLVLVLAGLLGLSYCVPQPKPQPQHETAATVNRSYVAGDFDSNGVQDLVLEQGAAAASPHLSPYFGIKAADGLNLYLSTAEMSRTIPENRGFYEGIEARLNQKGR